MRKSALVVILICFTVVVIGTFYVKMSPGDFEKNVRVKKSISENLIGDLKSFQSPGEVTSWLKSRKYTWEIISNSKLSEKDPRPEFSEFAIRVSDFADLGVKGTLELNFINRRLYKTLFYPYSYAEYLDKIGQKYHVDFSAKKIFKISNMVLVEIGENIDNKPYIQWKDISLENEITEWVKRFS